MATKQTVFLVIKASRDVRVAKKPRLLDDEVAIEVNITYPESWGKVIGKIDVTLPDNEPEIEYADPSDPRNMIQRMT